MHRLSNQPQVNQPAQTQLESDAKQVQSQRQPQRLQQRLTQPQSLQQLPTQLQRQSQPQRLQKLPTQSQAQTQPQRLQQVPIQSQSLQQQPTQPQPQSLQPSQTQPKPLYAYTKKQIQPDDLAKSADLIKKGLGSYGVVYEGYDVQTNEKVVIKKVKGIFDNQTNAVRFLREIKLLRILRGHPNLVKLKHVFQPLSQDFTELELVLERGEIDLYHFLNSDQSCTNEHIRIFAYQMFSGVSYLHNAGVIHRDLKPSNILLNQNCDLKICDFGLSRSHVIMGEMPDLPKPGHLFRQLTGYVVTRWYRSPELMFQVGYGPAVDMWSLGCILAELLTMQHRDGSETTPVTPLFPGASCYPFSKENGITLQHPNDQLNVIFDLIGTPSDEDIQAFDSKYDKVRQYFKNLPKKPAQDFSKKFPKADPQAIDLLKKLLVFNPAKRLTAELALSHPYISCLSLTRTNHLFGKNLSPEEKESLREYYQFEVQFEEQKKELDLASIRKLITQEIAVYKDAVAQEDDMHSAQPESDSENEYNHHYNIEYGKEGVDEDREVSRSNPEISSLSVILTRLAISQARPNRVPQTQPVASVLTGEPSPMPEQHAYYYLDSDESDFEEDQKKCTTVHELSPSLSRNSSPSSAGHNFFDHTVDSAQKNREGNSIKEIDTNGFIKHHFQ